MFTLSLFVFVLLVAFASAHDGHEHGSGNDNHIDDGQAFEGCGSTKSCFGMPAGCLNSKNCALLLTANRLYGGDNGTVQFEIIGKIGEGHDHWIAVGLSRDQAMGDDSVTECVIVGGGTVELRNSWNRGQTNAVLGDVAGITDKGRSFLHGELRCMWTRARITEVDGVKFDLMDDEYFVLLAEGMIVNGEKQHHNNRLYPDGGFRFKNAPFTSSSAGLFSSALLTIVCLFLQNFTS